MIKVDVKIKDDKYLKMERVTHFQRYFQKSSKIIMVVQSGANFL
jgi:hypothetical protein